MISQNRDKIKVVFVFISFAVVLRQFSAVAQASLKLCMTFYLPQMFRSQGYSCQHAHRVLIIVNI